MNFEHIMNIKAVYLSIEITSGSKPGIISKKNDDVLHRWSPASNFGLCNSMEPNETGQIEKIKQFDIFFLHNL